MHISLSNKKPTTYTFEHRRITYIDFGAQLSLKDTNVTYDPIGRQQPLAQHINDLQTYRADNEHELIKDHEHLKNIKSNRQLLHTYTLNDQTRSALEHIARTHHDPVPPETQAAELIHHWTQGEHFHNKAAAASESYWRTINGRPGEEQAVTLTKEIENQHRTLANNAQQKHELISSILTYFLRQQ